MSMSMSTSQPAKPLKILISAYACRPGVGSEPGVGWNIVRTLARHHDLCVLTREDNRSDIEAELSEQPIPNLRFIYCDPPMWASRLPSAQLPHYYLWQVRAYWVVRKLLESLQFDLIHHVTYVRYSTPSFLALLPVPFIWGPVGGGEQAPGSFWQSFGPKGKIYEVLRTLSHRFGEYDPFTRMTVRRSILARATTDDTAKRLYKLGATHVETSSALGLSQSEIDQLAQYDFPESGPIRFITIARLLHWKGIHLGIQAFAQIAQKGDFEYWILGDGPEQKNLEALTKDVNVANRVKFWGHLPREETLKQLADCHILVHPSLHDSGGFVCLEAMAAGRPVVGLDLGGSAIQVSQAAGILVPANSPQQAVNDLAEAMLKLAIEDELRNGMGQAGKKHVRENFSWEAKGEQLAKLYVDYAGIEETA